VAFHITTQLACPVRSGQSIQNLRPTSCAGSASDPRRTKTTRHAFEERAVLKPLYAALIRARDSRRGVRITELQLRPPQVLREDLESAYIEQNSPAKAATTGKRPAKVSSTNET